MSNTRNWKKHKPFCFRCRRWNYDPEHQGCPKGQTGSLVWLDVNNFDLGCGKCSTVWPLTENTLTCDHCGHVQKTTYVDSLMAVQNDIIEIRSHGNTTYALLKSGVVVAEVRSFVGQGYE